MSNFDRRLQMMDRQAATATDRRPEGAGGGMGPEEALRAAVGRVRQLGGLPEGATVTVLVQYPDGRSAVSDLTWNTAGVVAVDERALR